MAKVSLRIYNREIERLIEQGSVDEAIAHCRHILVTFPKHLETYRLLGKAYLEARRYSEAVDIFGRLLMAVPDDFVSHVGLSIIRDEENKLDDAIWHMERAFEVQPSNAAIQGELQRLYGRRDGMEPPKVRMTRGALARIYVQGDLYPQAIT
ncbi:MAG TPA: tetratricopeptide repeat protein, partial [Anaerolineales bacterium]|nr:tetratricopeptide repeat protein [Anaerolineales bacterium]